MFCLRMISRIVQSTRTDPNKSTQLHQAIVGHARSPARRRHDLLCELSRLVPNTCIPAGLLTLEFEGGSRFGSCDVNDASVVLCLSDDLRRGD